MRTQAWPLSAPHLGKSLRQRPSRGARLRVRDFVVRKITAREYFSLFAPFAFVTPFEPSNKRRRSLFACALEAGNLSKYYSRN